MKRPKTKKIYLAGPMSGLPNFNYHEFNAHASRLRAQGYLVENPAENPTPPGGAWTGYMRMAIAQLVQCDTVALLPGWETSRGAAIEHRLAHDLQIKVLPVAAFSPAE